MNITTTSKQNYSATAVLILAACLLFLLGHSAQAQNPLLLSDITTTPIIPINTNPEVVSNGILYFPTDAYPVHSLWRSDGTEQGTFLLINTPYQISFYGGNGASSNGLFFFTMNDGVHGYELWKSDGTIEGTSIVKDIIPGKNGPGFEFMATDQIMYLNIAVSSNHWQLWKSDGTEQGTVMVKDNLEVENFIALNGKLIFSTRKSDTGLEVWVTDGTSAGTHILKDINPGTADSKPIQFTELNNVIYFFAFQQASGNCLWRTDGTDAGTFLVKDFDLLSQANVSHGVIKEVNNKLFMAVSTTANGSELWVSDGSTAGTLLLEINPGIASSDPQYFVELDSKLYFNANDGIHGDELWRSDGTTVGTQLVKDINPGATDSDPGYSSNFNVSGLFSVNGQIYFKANDGVHGGEPWHSDGTSSGTGLLYDLTSGIGGSEAGNFLPSGSLVVFIKHINSSSKELWSTDGTSQGTISISGAVSDLNDGTIYFPVVLNNKVYFNANGEMWYTDGTVAGTQQVNLGSFGTASSYLHDMVKLHDNTYVFSADDDIHGDELWVTDGTPSGTSLLKDIYPGFNGSEISAANIVLDGKVFFGATSGSSEKGLWITDGTGSGTIKIADCDPTLSDVNNGSQLTYVVLNNVLYFVASTSGDQGELWRTDGTTPGTYQVSFITTGNAEVKDLALNNGIIYFHARSPVYGKELFRSDGTTAGTVIVKDINTNGDSSPQYLTAYNGKVYFKAYDGIKYKLWVTDGTASGTKLVKTNGGPIEPAYLEVAGNLLYFSATSPGAGEGLWKTDGTASGTTLIKDVDPDGTDGSLNFLTDVNGTLFFSAIEGIYEGLWKSDGSEAGTVKITQFAGSISTFHSVNSDLYFIVYGDDDREMWRSDGTACHTQKVDFVSGFSDETDILLVDGSTMFLGLLTPEYGQELWKFETTPISNVEICNGFDDDCNGMVDDNPVAIINPSGNITECKGVPVTLTTESGIGLNYQWLQNGIIISGANENAYTTTKGGNFSVSVSSSSGCSAISDVTHISRVDNPTATITPSGSLDICLTGSVDLVANSGSGYLYEWSRNSNKIPGATNQVFTATQKGKYTVKVTNSNGCSKVSSKVTVFSSCKESPMNEDDLTLNVYPNPASTILNIMCPNGENETGDIVSLLITNSIGQIVFSQPFTSTEMKIDVESFAAGMYILQLKTGTETVTKKFVKE